MLGSELLSTDHFPPFYLPRGFMVIEIIWPIFFFFIFQEWSLFPTSFPIRMLSFLSDRSLIPIKNTRLQFTCLLTRAIHIQIKSLTLFSKVFPNSPFSNFFPRHHLSQLKTTYQSPTHAANPLLAPGITHHPRSLWAALLNQGAPNPPLPLSSAGYTPAAHS